MFDSLSEAIKSAMKGESDARLNAENEPDPEKRKGHLAIAAAFALAASTALAALLAG